jgi:NAD(P)-dependent dehydrogenase (short-subunit alcohol dehydrogenase family)
VLEIETMFNAAQPRYPELRGKVAIITGSGKGIGKGIATRLGKEGMKVVINARSITDVERVTSELKLLGVEALAVSGDISKTEDIQRLIDKTLNNYQSIDLLVNNAANLHRVPFFNVSEEMFANELATNIQAPFLLSYKAAQSMRKAGSGNIIHISSVGGLRAHFPGLPYDATKGALDSMTRVMGIELAQFGIRVNGIAPGAIYTEHRLPLDDPKMVTYAQRIPLNRLGLPLEIGAAVAFLASDDAAYIIGQTIYVDGGITAQLSPPQYQI